MIESLLPIDQSLLLWLNGGSLFLDRLALLLTQGFVWVPLYLSLFYVVVKNNEKMLQIVLIVGCALLAVGLSALVSGAIVKPLVARPRPCLDPLLRHTVDVACGYRPSGFSFFSSHAANTMTVAMFFSLLVRSRLLTAALMFWSLFNCWTRLYLGVHYPSDILVGLLWGAFMGALGYLVYCRLYYRLSDKIRYISSHYTSTGYATIDIDVVLLVVTATFAIGFIVAMASL